MSQTSTLKIENLLKNDQYIIPIYQRNYAWGDTEIELLLTDLENAKQRDPNKNYYIGSLVVAKRPDDKFEVIDGQQRLTTFTLLANYLKRKYPTLALPTQPNVSFEFRQDSDTALKQLFDNDNVKNNELLTNFLQAKQSIEKHWGDKQEDLAKFILEEVEIIRTQVPPQTDLNHYFEIMNTRGEQLEKHEVLKARLMGKLAGTEQVAFAKLWDACSDMSRYVVMGFEKKLRDPIFGENWDNLPTDFDKLTQFIAESNLQNSQSAKVITENGEEVQPTLHNILTGKIKGYLEKDNETSERFNSVIDFPNFLMHVLRIYLETTQANKQRISDIPLDEKKLLENFDFLLKEQQQENIKAFALILVQCRFLFDKFVIKSDTSKEQDDHWSLLTIKPANKSSYQYNNTFAESENLNAIMLLSMFHVSHPARIYKNWLYAVMRWLFTHKTETMAATSYIQFLENLSDGYYFGYYAKADRQSEDFFNLIFDNDFSSSSFKTEINQAILNNLVHIGTNVPNFIFNRLDYLLWKKKMGNYTDFRFTFRSSVEHFYPQHPRNPSENYQTLKEKEIDHFGNLCLISQSTNSRFSNDMPTAKKANYGGKGHGSLKLELMMAMAGEFEQQPAKTIKEHGQEMIDILNGKTNS